MSTYLFQEARVGDEVNFNGHKLEIALDEEDNKCKDCFFNNLTCWGVSCIPKERVDHKSVYYKEIKKKKRFFRKIQYFVLTKRYLIGSSRSGHRPPPMDPAEKKRREPGRQRQHDRQTRERNPRL